MTRLRLHESPAVCYAPYYVAEALLQGEGFTEVQYVKLATWADQKKALAAGELDLTIQTIGQGSVAKNEISYFCALEVIDFSMLDFQI
jgi:hypothetical protein